MDYFAVFRNYSSQVTILEFKENARIIWLALFGSHATWRPALPVLLGVIGLILIIISLPPQLARTMVKENGPVESATVAAYVFVTVALWIRSLRVRSTVPLKMSFLSLLLACRELDFNKRFTSRNIENGFTFAYFFDFKVPDNEKLVVACVLILLFRALFIIAHDLWPAFGRLLGSKYAAAIMTLQAAFFLVLAQPLDEIGHILKRMGGSYATVGTLFGVLAETFELGVSLLLVVAFFRCEKRAEKSGQP